MANGFAFVSKDGNNAEVWVQKGKGLVTAIVPHENGKTANIQIQTEGLKFPQKAWINVDAPQYKVLQESWENRTPIDYRIESQRKAKNDKTKEPIPFDTPIAELRSSTEVARENTKTLLVSVNGEATDEAVTHPNADPSQSGRVPAADPLAAAPAPAPVHQEAPAQYSQPRGGHGAVEEPPYKEYNTDGSPNLGSYAVQAAVGAELFVRKALTSAGGSFTEDDVVRYASISLAIADKIQAYVTNKPRADRMATSHARVRSLVYDVIENFLPIPASQSNDADWVSKVGKLTLDRFNASLRIASQPFELASLNGGGAKAEAPAKASAAGKAAPKASAATPTETHDVAYPGRDEPKETYDVAVTEEEIVSPLQETSGNPLSGAKPAFELYPPVKIDAVTPENKMTEETLSTFKEFVTDSGADFGKLTKLLQHTFSVTKASQVPEEPFGDFLDFYVENGPENFLTVLDYVDTVS